MTAGNPCCPDCWHLWTLHRKGVCQGKVYPAHSLGGEPCPCENRPGPTSTIAGRNDLEHQGATLF